MHEGGSDRQELTELEQGLEQLLFQKKQFHSQFLEAEAALAALKTSTESYKVIGNIMVKTSSENLVKDLEEKRETLSVRIKSIEKQEDRLRNQAKEIQQRILQDKKTGK